MNHFPDVSKLSDSIWPFDTNRAPGTGTPRQFNKLRCFVLCPFARAELVMFMVHQAARDVGQFLNHEVEAYFAGDIGGSGAIHPDIWAHIRQADIVVADLTGYNPNVVYEFGVAAAWRPIDTIIIIRDKGDGQQLAFDFQPARHILYDSTKQGWMSEILGWLIPNMVQCLVRVPFRDEPGFSISLPFEISFEDNLDTALLWSPSVCHRRLNDGALEFGSPFYFPYSWLNPVGIRPGNVRVQASLRFTDHIDPSWIGIALRSQGYLADQEHLIWLQHDGKVFHTGPGLGAQGKDESLIGQLQGFDPDTSGFVAFDVTIDSLAWCVRVGTVEASIRLVDLPYVFGSGRILLQACRCRAAIRRICIDAV